MASSLPEGADAASLPADVNLDPLDGSEVVAGLTWVLDGLQAPDQLSEEEIGSAVTDAFLAEVSAVQLHALFTQIQGEYRIVTLDQADARSFVGEIVAGEQRWQLVIAVDEELRIETLFFGPPLADPESFDTWDEAEQALSELADEVSWLAAETTRATCEPIAAQASSTPRNIASISKLYVLEAVAEAVDAGELDWDDELVVTDELRSLPTGRLQDEPAGTAVTVREAAEVMIALSDNTAADLLLDAVGRDAVETAMTTSGHDGAGDMLPFLSTREVFQLLWQVDDAQRQEYATADRSRREELLSALTELELDIPIERVVQAPAEGERIGWFASPDQLCEVLLQLRERGNEDELAPVADALRANPIVRLQSRWTDWAAKGGSLPGVLGFAWDLERDDGRRFAFIVLLEAQGDIDMTVAIPRIEGSLDLLAHS